MGPLGARCPAQNEAGGEQVGRILPMGIVSRLEKAPARQFLCIVKRLFSADGVVHPAREKSRLWCRIMAAIARIRSLPELL